MSEKVIMSAEEMRRALVRIAHEVIEKNHGPDQLVFIGIYTRGATLAARIARYVKGTPSTSPPICASSERVSSSYWRTGCAYA